jgi:hypothetical protein
LVNFFEIECPNRIEIIASNSRDEAVNMVFSNNPGTEFLDDVYVREEHPENHKVEVSCIGFPIYKTLKEMYEELEIKNLPVQICELAW